jgi:hypothetical protein
MMSGYNFILFFLLSSVLFFHHLNAFETCRECQEKLFEENNSTNPQNEGVLMSQGIDHLDGKALQIWETEGVQLLSRQKRNFGGKEQVDYAKAFSGVFMTLGWLTQGLEAFSDINFHLLGYTALGKILTLKQKKVRFS